MTMEETVSWRSIKALLTNVVLIVIIDAECVNPNLDILYVVDGSGSIRSENFENITLELKRLNEKFDIGTDKTRIAVMQFGSETDTQIEFGLGEKSSLQAVNEGVDNMVWLNSLKTATGDALKKARELVRKFINCYKIF